MKSLELAKSLPEFKKLKMNKESSVKSISASLEYLRNPKTENKSEKMTDNLEDKFADTKKPFPSQKSVVSAEENPADKNDEDFGKWVDEQEVAPKTSKKKQAGPLLDRLNQNKPEGGALTNRIQQQKTQDQGQMQQISGLISGAIDKFRSLVFEVKGTDKVIEVAKVGEGLDMKVFEDRDSPTPSSQKKYNMADFVNFFMQKLAPTNADQVAQALSTKGVAEINKGTYASVRASLVAKDENPADKNDEDFGKWVDEQEVAPKTSSKAETNEEDANPFNASLNYLAGKKKASKVRCDVCNKFFEEDSSEGEQPGPHFCSKECYEKSEDPDQLGQDMEQFLDKGE